MRYLLDTNVVSDLVRRPHGQLATRIGRLSDEGLCTSIIVAAELRYGAAKRASARLTRQIEAVLAAILVQPWEHPADAIYGDIRAELESTGDIVGGNDLLIAAHAMTLDCTLLTANMREFSRVRGLRVENWLAP
jgi:tRNA(fMet)-specific endonuclease VapC